MQEDYRKAPKVTAWLQRLQESGCSVRRIAPLSVLHKGNGQVLFALLDVDALDPQGYPLPRYAFIRGDACIVVPLLTNRSTGEERFLMVRQRRIAHGDVALEFPAGMLDHRVDDPRGVAVQELREETGLELPAELLQPLLPHPLYSSPGASDEAIFYFGCRVTVDDDRWQSFEGSSAGAEHEEERITVTLQTRQEAEARLSSLQARLGFQLFQEHFE
jgi:8-oxo-dGTP pyrophosphatase MutT (NUDIX family)